MMLHFYQPAIWATLGLIGFCGLVAVVSPKRFENLASWGSRWVDTNRIFQFFDKRIDIDHHVLPFSRLLGFAVLLAILVLAIVLRHFA